jgi:hypothetical protein
MADQTVTADFVVRVGIAFAGRRPYRDIAAQLCVGEPVRLQRQPDNQHDANAILVNNKQGQSAGYLYAADAAYLSLLFDLAPPERDSSIVAATDGKKVMIDIRLHLLDTTPLFTLIAILGLNNEQFATAFNLAQNTFLQPLLALNRLCLKDYDHFQLPETIVENFVQLRLGHYLSKDNTSSR